MKEEETVTIKGFPQREVSGGGKGDGNERSPHLRDKREKRNVRNAVGQTKGKSGTVLTVLSK